MNDGRDWIEHSVNGLTKALILFAVAERALAIADIAIRLSDSQKEIVKHLTRLSDEANESKDISDDLFNSQLATLWHLEEIRSELDLLDLAYESYEEGDDE